MCLDLLSDGSEEVINVFIHGFLSVSTLEKYLGLCQMILKASPMGRAYLYNWPSSGTKIPALGVPVRRVLQLTKLNPASILWMPAEMAAEKVISVATQFLTAKRQSEKAGKKLLHKVSLIQGAKNLPINLIGHSLGARVIQYSLANSDWSKYDLRKCILLGGAADLNASWGEMLEKVNDRIINVYSQRDKILSLERAFGNSKKVGKYPINSPYNGIENRHYRSFGHSDYWMRLPYILPRLGDDLKRSKIYEEREAVYEELNFAL